MLLKAIILLFGTLTHAGAQIGGPAYTYLVLTPRNIRPGATLTIPVHFATPVTTETVTVKLIQTTHIPGLRLPDGSRGDGKSVVTVLAEVSKTVPSGESGVEIQLQAPTKISWGNYNLNVTGDGSVMFHNSTTVYGQPKSMAIFVQTDKAMYKPGETVQYRIFVVDRKLALTDPTLDIEFFDPKGNKIDEQTGVKNKLGVEGSLPLSDMPPLGRWKISVNAKDFNEREDYTFEVREYVLPKFEVTVSLPSFGKESDRSLTGTAKAAYTFGKPVQGNVVLTISKRYGSSFFDARAIKTNMAIDGTVSFTIPMTILERLTRNIGYENFVVHANVTEAITGITLEGQSEIRYYSNPYKIEFFPNMPDNFKPGFDPYKVWVKVSQQDGRPPESVKEDMKVEKMKVTVTYFTDKRVIGQVAKRITLPNYDVIAPFIDGDVIMKETMSFPLGLDGTVKFELRFPENTATVSIKAEYAGQDTYKEVRRFRSPNDVFLKTEMLNDVNTTPLKIGDIASIKVTSSSGPVTAKYVVLSRGQLVASGDISIAGQFNEGVAQIPVTRDMAPTSRFVVYYVRPDGEIVPDGLNFVIEDIFENKVTIEFVQSSPQQPKASVDLKVTADKDSFVNVLVVDKSVLLLAEGNDITPSRVKDEMNKFGDSPWILRGWGPMRPWSFAADDAYDIFDNAKLKVLTDANLYRFDLWRLEQVQTSSKRAAFASNDAMMGAGGSGMDSATGQIRKDFPETWIWKSAVASNGQAVFPDVVPDTITEFVANAFALNLKTGLGVAPSTANLTVFLPFFVNLQLPYSVVRHETAVIQANIFNYRDRDHNVLVRLQGSNDFVGISVGTDNSVTEVKGDITKCVRVIKGKPTPVFFNIKPLKVKDMVVNVRASISTPPAVFDEVIRTLPVKAEGTEKEKNTPILISFQTMDNVVKVTDIAYPTELVKDSERIRVTVIGDIFGPTLKNLEKLIKLPYGCGEQNMVNFAPSVFAAAYMRKTGRFDNNQELMDKIKKVLRTGYQRQLLYQRNEGSFSAFGNADSEGSLWLTSFVIKSFAQAKGLDIIFIDPNVIDKAVRFIIDNQNKDGTINNIGTVSHKALQGGSAASNRSMTAYVLLALQEVKQAEILVDLETIRKMDEAIYKLTDVLIMSIPEMTTDYEKAIGAYALKMVNNPADQTLLTSLESSTSKVIEGNKKHWKNPSRALEIEITSYALLTYSLRADKTNGLMILQWLVDNRNPYGGFSSTQDTVVALQALSEFATLVYSKVVALTVDIWTRTGGVNGAKRQLTLNTANHDVLQYEDFDGAVEQVVIEVKGTGLAMIDINQFYNVLSEGGLTSYELTVTTLNESKNKYTVRACARYNITNSGSNMAIMNVGVVSGFEPVKDQVVKSPLIKRLELSSGRLIIYFDEIPKTEVCVNVPAQRISLVSGLKPANVIVYSYYEPTERIMKDYIPLTLKAATLCTTCVECCLPKNLKANTQCQGSSKPRGN